MNFNELLDFSINRLKEDELMVFRNIFSITLELKGYTVNEDIESEIDFYIYGDLNRCSNIVFNVGLDLEHELDIDLAELRR